MCGPLSMCCKLFHVYTPLAALICKESGANIMQKSSDYNKKINYKFYTKKM